MSGLLLLQHIHVVHETEIPNQDTVDYIKSHNWILTAKNPEDLPELQKVFDSVSREIIDHYKNLFSNFRPIYPIVMDKDGLILEGWYRTIAAKEVDHTISAFVQVD